MSTLWIVLIVLLVLGVVVGNVMLLKSSARFKLPKDYVPPSKEEKAEIEKKEKDKPSSFF
ncbi:DUF2897 family protein [Alteromonas pelagimontana]|uniref:DUF2897 family protein n=1 Tax=Alteromonas pelagimontana TaxID=1858656 RepID=A0A6M4M904_9ALTE|nr:DUF2897 family protein [Alteromonas pelagimontana]QJR79671.1 DUF2897 family protein [Alteromonas pelagimontana]